MNDIYKRSELLLGNDAISKLKNSHVAIFGVGGVGGSVVEALVRCGIGKITIVDNDKVDATNLNRQIISLSSNIGQFKTDVLEKRIKDINHDIKVDKKTIFFDENSLNQFDFNDYDYVVDAIDSIKSKILLIKTCYENSTKIISSMGTGNKLDPTLFKVGDVYKTSVCPLAKIMRHELKKVGVKKLKVVYSTEPPLKPSSDENGKIIVGSVSFVPSVCGNILAGEVIKDLIRK